MSCAATAPKKEPTSAGLIMALALTGLLAGVVLSWIYSVTLPMIRANEAAAIRRAIFQVLPGTASYQTYVVENGNVNLFTGDVGDLPVTGVLYMGLDEQGQMTGLALSAEGAGFMDTIKVLYGFKPDQSLIVGLSVLESKETPGLGDKIMKDPDFLASFLSLQVKPVIEGIKDGTRAPNQVDMISGATISSKAVINILNAGIAGLPADLPRQAAEKEAP